MGNILLLAKLLLCHQTRHNTMEKYQNEFHKPDNWTNKHVDLIMLLNEALENLQSYYNLFLSEP